jgi:hypothetical protein
MTCAIAFALVRATILVIALESNDNEEKLHSLLVADPLRKLEVQQFLRHHDQPNHRQFLSEQSSDRGRAQCVSS